jgi:multidrug efflux pump
MEDYNAEFKPTTWAIKNKTSIYLATLFITILGLITYNSLPKENFPEVVIPQIFVATIYAGTGPADMENVVTKVLEKEIKSISGVKKITSNSMQDFSTIIVEFNTGIKIDVAKQKVKDAVDKARTDLPNDLTADPEVIDINLADLPIMNVNLSGDVDLLQLKEYAEDIKDRFESVKEINRVDIVGALEREIQVNVDMYKMAAAGASFMDIENAIRFENMTISGGEMNIDGTKWAVSVKGEYKNPLLLNDLIIRTSMGGTIYLRDIAQIEDTTKEQESYARLNNKNVITLNVVKRSGENLISASDNIKNEIAYIEANVLPKNVEVTVTQDQSVQTETTLHDLINTIILGFLFVTFVLMFFMGTSNALFVGLSVPLSAFLAFLVLQMFGYTMNMIVLFSFLLGLGIVVDDAVVVIENTHRIYANGKMSIFKAVRIAAGEVFLPVFTGTIVTLLPFVPLLFWPGIIGDFMYYLPFTLIIMLLASLLVAYIINPVFAVDFMKPHKSVKETRAITKGFKMLCLGFLGIIVVGYMVNFGLGNLMLVLFALILLNKFVFSWAIERFQTKTWPAIQNRYFNMVTFVLRGKRPILVLVGGIVLFIISIVFTVIRQPKVDFFPKSDPNYIITYLRLPIGTHQTVTDSITRILEERIYGVIGEDNPMVQSVISNVAIGAGTQDDNQTQAMPHLGKVTVAFVEFAKRNEQSTVEYLDKIRKATQGIAGAEITVDQEESGPPTGKPINIEISGDNFDELIDNANKLKSYIQDKQIGGIEELRSDFQSNKPEIIVTIDRRRANQEGISTAQIGSELRTSIFGKEISKYRDDKDEYEINLRVREDQRGNISNILNIPLTYRDMGMGGLIRQVPLSSVAKVEYSNTYAGIKRINKKRVISLSSNVLTGYTANEVVANIQAAVNQFDHPDSIGIRMTGEQEDQAETSGFLGYAFLVAFGLIFLVLVMQFNSTSKPLIILSEIVFSLTGVLLGFSIFNMNISIVMTGVGVFALAGIIVRNGILLVEFTDLLLSQGMELRQAAAEAAKTRMTPVILTAVAAILGLIPLAVGLNMDFVKLFTELDPHIYFGGDNVAFWGPLSWTMIFGLIFGTFLTLIMVPSLLVLIEKSKTRIFRLFGREYTAEKAALRKANMDYDDPVPIETDHTSNH